VKARQGMAVLRSTAWATLAVLGALAPARAQTFSPTNPNLPPPVTSDTPGALQAPASTSGEQGLIYLSVVFAGDPKPVRSGLVWRVFEDRGDGVRPVLAAKSDDAAPSFSLPPGAYIVHAAYGFAGASKRVQIRAGQTVERLAISAGALKLGGAIGETPLAPARLAFSVFVPIGNNSEGRLIAGGVKGGEVVRLPEGSYHVVSTYGDSNAIMRADLRVEAGRVTEATLNHRAATVTLKLVASAGGEAFAGTAFSVLTPGGDVIREAIGAFPSVTLAEGEYVLIARHEGKIHTREFKVESGLDRDIEILAK
jgi:hypothetical protein